MNFLKYDEKLAIKVAREEALEKGIIEGMKKGETYVLELMEQGLSYEEIKKKLNKPSRKNR